ncbi:MAG: YaeQ family protein [Methylophilaceae bacterium]
MALKSTIHKVDLQIADMDRNYYAQHNLTIARHPSETDERMMVRLIAFILFAEDSLAFAKGLSAEDEPDLWLKDLTGAIELWIDVGLPDEREVRKACGRAKHVAVILYGGRTADMWWSQNEKSLTKQNHLTIINLPDTAGLSALTERTMSLSCNIQDGTIWLNSETGTIEITPQILKKPAKG